MKKNLFLILKIIIFRQFQKFFLVDDANMNYFLIEVYFIIFLKIKSTRQFYYFGHMQPQK